MTLSFGPQNTHVMRVIPKRPGGGSAIARLCCPPAAIAIGALRPLTVIGVALPTKLPLPSGPVPHSATCPPDSSAMLRKLLGPPLVEIAVAPLTPRDELRARAEGGAGAAGLPELVVAPRRHRAVVLERERLRGVAARRDRGLRAAQPADRGRVR